MVITNLEEKENRKIWVPIRGGNRGGWSLFDWEKVREMPYRDRQMYLGNSAKIGVLDKGGKWRKKDWYLKRTELTASQLEQMRGEAMRKDQQRMNTALGYVQKDDDLALTPAQMQLLLKKIKGGGVQQPVQIQGDAIGLGFDKAKVEIRAKPTVKTGQNPHRLEGTFHQEKEPERQQKQKKEKSKKKHKKQRKHRQRSKSRGSQRNQHLKPYKQDQVQHEKKEKKNKSRQRSRSVQKEKHRRRKSQSSQSKEREKHRKRQKYQDNPRHKDSEKKNEKYHNQRSKSKKNRYYSQSD